MSGLLQSVAPNRRHLGAARLAQLGPTHRAHLSGGQRRHHLIDLAHLDNGITR